MYRGDGEHYPASTRASSLLDRIGTPAKHPPHSPYGPSAAVHASPTPGPSSQQPMVSTPQPLDTQSADRGAPSEATVDEFLASVLATNVVASQIRGPSSEPSSNPPAHPVPVAHADLIKECRNLMVPQVMANVSRRNPYVDQEVAERRARVLVTDEWCEEMLQHARRAREEMRRRGLTGAGQKEGRRSNGVRFKNEDGRGEASLTLPISSVPAVEDGTLPVPGPMQENRSSQVPVLDSAARVLEDFLAGTPQPPANIIAQPHSDIVASIEPSSVSQTINVPTKMTTQPAATPNTPAVALPTCPTASLNDVSGIWSVRVGSRLPEIAVITLSVQDDVAASAQRWARRHKEFDDRATHAAVHLLCLPAAAATEAIRTLDSSSPSHAFADTMWDIPTSWPAPGALVVRINSGDEEHARVFLPAHLGPSTGPLDVTPHIRPGVNTIQLVHLQDLSDRIFVVHAAVPAAQERRRFATQSAEARQWAAFAARVAAREQLLERISTPASLTPFGGAISA